MSEVTLGVGLINLSKMWDFTIGAEGGGGMEINGRINRQRKSIFVNERV